MSAILGASPTSTYTDTEVQNGRGLGPGKPIYTWDGKYWLFLKATSAVSAARACLVADDNSGAAHLTNATNKSGSRVAFPQVDVPSGYWGFFQIYGPASIRVAASCVGGAKLYTTATAGVLDDTSGTPQDEVTGVVLTTTVGGAETTAVGSLNYPNVNTTA